MKRMKCYIYTRVSTSMQVDGYSLDAQKDKLRKYAEFQNMLVAGEYCDEGKSGKNIEGRIAEVQTRMDNIRQRRISTDNVYQFLLYFDKLYDQFTDLEKKTFMNSFIERVEIYPERQSDGRIIKRIEFRFPVYVKGSEISGLCWDETDMSETVCVLSKLQEGKTYRD